MIKKFQDFLKENTQDIAEPSQALHMEEPNVGDGIKQSDWNEFCKKLDDHDFESAFEMAQLSGIFGGTFQEFVQHRSRLSPQFAKIHMEYEDAAHWIADFVKEELEPGSHPNFESKVNEAKTKKDVPNRGLDVLRKELKSELECLPDEMSCDDELIETLKKNYPDHATKIAKIADAMGDLGNDYSDLAEMHDEERGYDSFVKTIERRYQSIAKKIDALK